MALTKKEKKFAAYKAGGWNQSQAVQKAYPDMKPTTARVYGTKLMKKEDVQNEIALLKQAFRERFKEQAMKNWEHLMNKKPDSDEKMSWADFIRANEKTMEMMGMKNDKVQASFKDNKFVQYFYGKDTESEEDKQEDRIQAQQVAEDSRKS